MYGATAVPENGGFYQYPNTGNGLARMQIFYDEFIPQAQNYYRDYLQGRLTTTLTAGTVYCVSFHMSLADLSNYAINRIGAYLDDGSIDNSPNCGLPQTQFTPQVAWTGGIFYDTANWVKVEGTFTANGTERFITIGNFYNKANTSYTDIRPNCISGCHYSWMLIDDVSVTESNLPAYAGNDTTIYAGDTIQIGRMLATQLDCKWYTGTMLIDSGALIQVHPNVTTTYIVEQTLCGLVKYDTVTVTVVPLGVAGQSRGGEISIYPNPATTELVVKMDKLLYSKAIITNNIGQEVRSLQLDEKETKIDIRELPPGLYFIRLEGEKGPGVRKFLKI